MAILSIPALVALFIAVFIAVARQAVECSRSQKFLDGQKFLIRLIRRD
jgi:hypothetical protein